MSKPNILCSKEDHNPIWLMEESNPQWSRSSKDNKGYNHFGEELLTLCGTFDLIIYKGLETWKNSGNFTYKTYNGASVVDYIICSQSFIERIQEIAKAAEIREL